MLLEVLTILGFVRYVNVFDIFVSARVVYKRRSRKFMIRLNWRYTYNVHFDSNLEAEEALRELVREYNERFLVIGDNERKRKAMERTPKIEPAEEQSEDPFDDPVYVRFGTPQNPEILRSNGVDAVESPRV